MEPNLKKTSETEIELQTKKPDTGVKNIEEREIEETETGSQEEEKRENEGYVDFSKLF